MQITRLHQIELTSRCNLRCKYCVHPTMQRPKIDMTDEIYYLSLDHAARCVSDHGQAELNLAGIGESTMHPRFIPMVLDARRAVGPAVRLVITTNGILVTDEMLRELRSARPNWYVSLHRPEKAGPAIQLLKRYGMLAGVSADPSIAAVDWAGQVEWHTSTPLVGSVCPWLRDGMVFVMADGRITRCCFDGAGIGVIGSVRDPIATLSTGPYSLCKTCHHSVP